LKCSSYFGKNHGVHIAKQEIKNGQIKFKMLRILVGIGTLSLGFVNYKKKGWRTIALVSLFVVVF